MGGEMAHRLVNSASGRIRKRQSPGPNCIHDYMKFRNQTYMRCLVLILIVMYMYVLHISACISKFQQYD